jgi:threonine-phosphate decarboxylase
VAKPVITSTITKLGPFTDGLPIPADYFHGGGHDTGLIDFSISINPLGPPRSALDEYHAAAERITSYPRPYPIELERCIAAKAGVEPENVIAGNGSTQLIHLIFRALRLRRPCIAVPTFSEIANAAIVFGSPAIGLLLREEDGFAFPFDAAANALARGADAIFLGRPNSPTGTVIPLAIANRVAQQCAVRGAWCIFDEAFIDFTNETSMAELAASHPRIIVLRSMTKIFAIPGLRLGFAIAAQETVTKLRHGMEPWSVSVPAERTGVACLTSGTGYLFETRRIVNVERGFLVDHLRRHPLISVFSSAANFLMLTFVSERRAGEFGSCLMSAGIAIRDLAKLPGCRPGHYRIGVRLRKDNERLVEAATRWNC